MQLFIYQTFVYPLIYIFPAYAANGAPVLFGGGKPLDFGLKAFGKRIFGNNKTIRGTASAILAGFAVGIIEYVALGFSHMLLISLLLAVGAMLGDLLGSFIKRRLGLKSGSMFPIMDQYGFFAFALLLAYPAGNMPTIYGTGFIIALTGVAHLLTNIGANKLKLKSVPW